MTQLPNTTLPGNQRGATLIVALILLILISLIGASSLKNASVAEKIAAADYQRNITFQSSESVAMQFMKSESLISQAMDGVTEPTMDTNMDKTEATVTIVKAGVGPLLDNTLNGPTMVGQRLIVTSTSNLAADDSAATQTVHGLVRKIPSGL